MAEQAEAGDPSTDPRAAGMELDRATIAQLQGEVDQLTEALRLEKADHLETMKRWVKIADGQAKRIAKARKLMRDSQYGTAGHDDFYAVYRALDWRRR